jgi:hypothetical protein
VKEIDQEKSEDRKSIEEMKKENHLNIGFD